MTRKLIALAAAGALGGIAILAAAQAGQTPQTRGYAPSQAISHPFGSKRAVGYFAAKDGNCAMTMFLTEAEDGHVAPSAARIRFTVKPGDSAELASAEGAGLEVKCAENGAAVEVRQTSLTASATQ